LVLADVAGPDTDIGIRAGLRGKKRARTLLISNRAETSVASRVVPRFRTAPVG
jgi:hypothetical protein